MVRRFRSDRGGQIAVIFALASMATVIGVGSGIDLSRAFFARQKLSEVATLTCQFSTRPSVVDTANSTSGGGSSGFQSYLTAVNAFAASSLAGQHWNTTNPTGSGGGQYFTATQATGSSGPTGTAPTNPVTDISASIPTSFMQIVKIPQITVHARVACQTAAITPPGADNPYVLQEGFETSCATYCFTLPNGTTGTQSTPSSFPSSPGYTGPNGAQWYITGYCLEIDAVGQINSSDPQGTHSAELDCDNGSGTAGNSSISSKIYLPNGNYELRYNYRSRIDYPNYDPTYICGSTAADLAWANDPDTNGPFAGSNAVRGNQLNVYLDMNTTGAAPLHTTLDGTEQLAGSNLIDMCVYSNPWIERSVKITVTTPAYYWLSFSADGANSSYGGQLDNIRVCKETCPTTLQDNFPSAWLASNNYGANPVLFNETFASPVVTANTAYYTNTSQNLYNSPAKIVPQAGWPSQVVTGWSVAPLNQITYVTTGGSGAGGQYIELDNCATTCSNGNRLVSRPFLLDPGYYQVGYYYMSMDNFPGIGGAYCYSAPTNGFTWGTQTVATAQTRYQPSTIAVNGSTNILEVFMSNGQLVSTPNVSSTTGATTTYANPDGTTTTTPTYSPDTISASNYNASQNNPLLDTCGYSASYVWLQRTVNIKISKVGMYWLTFSTALSAADGAGAGIDSVTLTALGSPYMATPPASPLVAIPVPAPQNDTDYSNNGAFTGFYIVADPFTPPAADQ